MFWLTTNSCMNYIYAPFKKYFSRPLSISMHFCKQKNLFFSLKCIADMEVSATCKIGASIATGIK